MNHPKTGDEELERSDFNEWFTHLLHSCETCLLRDILRNQKENLFAEWLAVKPMEDSND